MYSTSHNRPVFKIPLASQRYCWVKNFIEQQPTIKSVTDIGCGNGRFINWLKGITRLEKINCVDSDNITLEEELDRYLRPGLVEKLFGRQGASNELQIKVYNADITNPSDLLMADCMVMIEVIEHMLPQDVARATRSIFGYYQPEFIVVTTPNIEFNHLLRSPDEPADLFRHHDHKFEWTRTEFMQWTQEICDNYPYEVRIDGVGHLPGSEPFGPCTQIAAFRRLIPAKNDNASECCDLLFDRLDMSDSQPLWGYTSVKKRVVLKGDFTIPPQMYKQETLPSIDWSKWSD